MFSVGTCTHKLHAKKVQTEKKTKRNRQKTQYVEIGDEEKDVKYQKRLLCLV